MKCLLVGYGEVGEAIYDFFKGYHKIQILDPNKAIQPDDDATFDILLVCFPYDDNFISNVKQYILEYRIKATLIFSTVQIGTTEQIKNAVHCPIEGKHPYMLESLKQWKFLMGGYNKLAKRFFDYAIGSPRILEHSRHSEALKLLSTSLYGTLIEYTRYAKSVCDELNMDFEKYTQYNIQYNNLYKNLLMDNYIRPILMPPEGNIGGHCVVPNSKLLDDTFPSIFLKEIYKEKVTL